MTNHRTDRTISTQAAEQGAMNLMGTVEVRGHKIEWRRNPATGGWTLFFGCAETIQLDTKPTQEVATAALDSYEQGKRHGEQIGRAVLQNQFKNLMDLG
jgi:hypothetical protein